MSASAPTDKAKNSNRVTGSGPAMESRKPSAPPKSGGSNFYPPQAPKPPAPPKFGGDPGFKGPSERLKPKGPRSERLKPQPPKIKPLPYTGTPGGLTKTLPYTGTPGTKMPYAGGGN